MQELIHIIGTFDMIRSLFEESSPAAKRWSPLLQLPKRSERKGYPLPPGPIPLSFCGSVLSINTQSIWFYRTEVKVW